MGIRRKKAILTQGQQPPFGSDNFLYLHCTSVVLRTRCRRFWWKPRPGVALIVFQISGPWPLCFVLNKRVLWDFWLLIDFLIFTQSLACLHITGGIKYRLNTMRRLFASFCLSMSILLIRKKEGREEVSCKMATDETIACRVSRESVRFNFISELLRYAWLSNAKTAGFFFFFWFC